MDGKLCLIQLKLYIQTEELFVCKCCNIWWMVVDN